MTSEYVAHTRFIEAAEGDRRTELLNIMLSGYDESDGRIARLLKSAGYLDQRQSYCVVAVGTPLAGELENPERAQRVVAALADLFAPTSIRVLAGLRNSLVLAIASAFRRQSGWTAPQTNLAERLTPLLMQLGPSVLVGISDDRPSTATIPKALREARAALDFASVDRRVVLFSGLPVRSLLLHAGGEYVRSAAPAWTAALLAADEKADGTLVRTLLALADADLNVQKAGRRLKVHPNTVYARLHRIREVTGLDGQRHHDLVEPACPVGKTVATDFLKIAVQGGDIDVVTDAVEPFEHECHILALLASRGDRDFLIADRAADGFARGSSPAPHRIARPRRNRNACRTRARAAQPRRRRRPRCPPRRPVGGRVWEASRKHACLG